MSITIPKMRWATQATHNYTQLQYDLHLFVYAYYGISQSIKRTVGPFRWGIH